MFDTFKAAMTRWNLEGLPIPLLKDPKNGKGSITATMFWIAFNMCLISGIIFIVTALAHLTGYFKPGDATQEALKNASQYFLELYMAAGSFYLGRKMMKDPKGNLNIDPPSDDEAK